MLIDVLFPINADSFTYTVPEELRLEVKKWCRVKAPFRRGEKVGIVTAVNSSAPKKKEMTLKPVTSVLDDQPLISNGLFSLIQWTGEYYMSSPGLALKNAVPSHLFTGKKSGKSRILYETEKISSGTIKLTFEQQKALGEINKKDQGVFLLHGVTGSGKTEVYINAVLSLPDDRQAIILVPEIAITAQMMDRFTASFGDKAVFFHSGLSPGERLDAWWKMRRGEAKVVVGVRSAVFSPFTNLGLIVVDEEQEASYKQFEGLRYNARDAALARAQLENIKVILGSATPSMEAFYNARKGKFSYLALTHRIENKILPEVEIIDMTSADKQTFSFSTRLLDSIKENLAKGHQSLIMINRRGYSPFFICIDCGYVYKCPACSITLIYHKDTNTLNCHYCNSHLNPKELCPNCKGTRVKQLGSGTQRVEEELNKIVPDLLLQRMDRDSTRKKLSHFRIVKQMEEKKIDLLLGTQMVAKGHDFPDVTLAAVVHADIALNLPDFRSAERAFQLFTQLAGRAGRGQVLGKSLIQTYETENYVFDYVCNHDYKGFYDKEISLRKELSYPPFSKLIRIIMNFRNKDVARRSINTVTSKTKALSRKNIEILGPAPAPIEKIKNLWRWHIILKGKNAKIMRQLAADIMDIVKKCKDVRIDVDVDPLNMM